MKIQCPIFDTEFVRSLIPHDHPFLMVDCLIQFTPDSATSQWTIKAGNIFVTDRGMMDSYGLMEHIAQTAALHKGYAYYLNDRQPPMGYLAEVKKTVFLRLPELEEQVITHIRIISEFNGISMIEFKSYVRDQEIANGNFKTFTKI